MNETNRREFLIAAGAIGATVTVGAEFAPRVAGAGESGGSWTTFRGNAGRTGSIADGGPGLSVITDRSFDLGGEMHTVEPVVGGGTCFWP